MRSRPIRRFPMPTNDPTIAWVLDRATNINPHGDATIDLGTGERRDWAEVARRVDGVASGLNSIDLDRGDRVGVLMLNSARHLELWFAIPVAGMVMNDLNFRLATEERTSNFDMFGAWRPPEHRLRPAA